MAGIGAEIFEASSDKAQAWLIDHRIFGQLLVPAAAVLETLAVAAGKVLGLPQRQLTGFSMHRPLTLAEQGEGQARWQVVVKSFENGRAELEWHEATCEADGEISAWHRIASAVAEAAAESSLAKEPPALASISVNSITADAVYAEFKALGAEFGPAFRCLRKIERGKGFARAWIELPEDLEQTAAQYALHPVLIDAGLQLCSLAAASRGDRLLPEDLYLPLGADRIVIHPTANRRLRGFARTRETTSGATLVADVWLETEEGKTAALIEGMRFARAEPGAFAAIGQTDDVLYDVAWELAPALPASGTATAEGMWLLFADRSGTADGLAEKIQAAGGRCCRVLAGDAFKRTSEHSWIIDPAEPEHFSRLLLEGGWSGANPLRGVVHFWSLDVATIGRESVGTTVTPDLLGPGAVLHLVQSLATAQAIGSGSLWLVTRGAQTVNGAEPVEELSPRAAGLWGLASVIAIEQPDLKVRLVDLDPGEARASGAGLIKELLENTQPRIAIRGTQRWVPRLHRYGHAGAVLGEKRDGRLLRVELVQPGTLDGLELQSCASAPLRPDEVRLRVLTAGINFRDVLIALGMYPGADVPLGAECAGVVTEIGAAVTEFRVGDRVIGFAPASLATEAIVPAAFLAPLPEGMNAENAAGLPVAFLTAYYGLQRLARLRRGERVLIHAAAGGVGLAAVQLVQRQGGEVFATAGSPAKRELLRKMGVQHVMELAVPRVYRSDSRSDEWRGRACRPQLARGRLYSCQHSHAGTRWAIS